MISTKKSEAQERLVIENAKANNDIRALLRPWYTFRIHIKFKKAFLNKMGQKQYGSHFFGYEENCTYNQCFFGHATEILLNKQQGFDRCVQMAEEQYKGKYQEATIYSRSIHPFGLFDVRHRVYSATGKRIYEQVDEKSGEVTPLVDPVLTEDSNVILYFTKISNYLVVHPAPEVQEGEVPEVLWMVRAASNI